MARLPSMVSVPLPFIFPATSSLSEGEVVPIPTLPVEVIRIFSLFPTVEKVMASTEWSYSICPLAIYALSSKENMSCTAGRPHNEKHRIVVFENNPVTVSSSKIITGSTTFYVKPGNWCCRSYPHVCPTNGNRAVIQTRAIVIRHISRSKVINTKTICAYGSQRVVHLGEWNQIHVGGGVCSGGYFAGYI